MILVVGMLACIALPIIVVRPQYGAYIILLANPIIVGIARGQFGSVLRPNELLLAFVLTAFSVRGVLVALGHRRCYVSFGCLDIALLALVATGSVAPLLWQYARGLTISQDDLLYAIVLIKYYALFRVFRFAITSPRQVETCLTLSIVSALVVAVIGFLQVSNLFGVPEFLLGYYDQPFEGHDAVMTERATSTVASAFGSGDLMIMNTIIALATIQATKRFALMLPVTITLLAGCIATVTFSVYVGLLVALSAFAVISGRFRQMIPVGVAGIGLAAFLLQGVLANRMQDFREPAGLPQSWVGRWDNLETYFFPDLFSGANWVLGVRSAPRVPALETWREYVYLESGYLWLLWVGGIPLFAAFGFFAIESLRTLRRAAQARTDAIGVAAMAGFSYLVAMIVMMLFDPHLTLRGSADLFFPLLALSSLPEALSFYAHEGGGVIGRLSYSSTYTDCASSNRGALQNFRKEI